MTHIKVCESEEAQLILQGYSSKEREKLEYEILKFNRYSNDTLGMHEHLRIESLNTVYGYVQNKFPGVTRRCNASDT